MVYDVAELRENFPSLRSGNAHFDGPGGTQTPTQVAEAIATTLTGPLSNRGPAALSETNAEKAVWVFRVAFSDLVGVPPQGIVYGRSATQLIYDFSRAISKQWGPGDEIVVSRLDHDANVRPWIQAADSVGATVRWIDFDPRTGEIDWDTVTAAITSRTQLVAITAASNLIGTKPPVPGISVVAHEVGALLFVDGVHYAAHEFVDMEALGADLFVCSPYKFFGPHCGVLAAAPELLETLWPDKLLPSTSVVPERFELGTLPYEIMAGAAAAVDFIASIDPGDNSGRRERLRSSFRAIDAHESRLRDALEDHLVALPRVVLHSNAANQTPTLLLTIRGRTTWDAYMHLASCGVLAPAGSFYAYEPFMRLGLDDPHGLRFGLAPYTTDEDVERAVAGLAEFLTQ